VVFPTGLGSCHVGVMRRSLTRAWLQCAFRGLDATPLPGSILALQMLTLVVGFWIRYATGRTPAEVTSQVI